MQTPVENGIDLNELSRSGSVLQIHYDDFEDKIPKTNEMVTSVEDTLGEPPKKSFEELAEDMEVIDKYGFVRKKMLEEGGGGPLDECCTIGIAYSGYFEGEKTPFYIRPPIKPLDCNMRESSLLCGLYTAVLSMRVGELSLFLLSYKVMFGEMGNPPKVKPKADCLFYIKVVRSKLTPDIMDSIDQPNMFIKILKECKGLYKSGWNFFHNSNTSMAIRCFNKAVNILHHTRLKDEDEEKKQEEMLLKLYYNLAICYNHMKNPRRACCMCNEINRLQTIWKNGKALFQNAKALRMIGDFEGAEKRLKHVMKLVPNMKREIEAEMKKLSDQREAYNKSLLIASEIVEQTSNFVSEEFKMSVDSLVKQFVDDSEICKIELPESLNQAEYKYLEEIAKKHNIFCINVKKKSSLDKTAPSSKNYDIFDD